MCAQKGFFHSILRRYLRTLHYHGVRGILREEFLARTDCHGLLLFSVALFTSKIVEMEVTKLFSMSSLLEQIPLDLQETICGFDIDGTLIEPCPCDLRKRVPVEDITKNVMLEIAKRGGSIILITARVPGTRTWEELNEAGFGFLFESQFRPIVFLNHIISSTEFGDVEYRDGVLFASNMNKGLALTSLLDSTSANIIKPRSVIYVDDAISEATNICREMTEKGIPNKVFRYMAPDREHFEY